MLNVDIVGELPFGSHVIVEYVSHETPHTIEFSRKIAEKLGADFACDVENGIVVIVL